MVKPLSMFMATNIEFGCVGKLKSRFIMVTLEFGWGGIRRRAARSGSAALR